MVEWWQYFLSASLILLAVAASLFPADVWAQVTEDQKLLGRGGGVEPYFGFTVALVETEKEALALVGSPRDTERGFNAGAVYAYRYNETADEWVEEAKFWPDEVGENSFVGVKVALTSDGSLALVSGYEPGEKDFYGRVHIFRRSDGGWVETTTLVPSDKPPFGTAFGCSIAVSTDGEVVVVGACQDDLRGAVYIFRRDASSAEWVEEAKLTTERLCFFNGFGAAVAVSAAGDRVTTTEPCGEGGDPSALYFFHQAGSPSDPNGGWVREARFDSYGGGAVALSEGGDLALAGPLFFSTVWAFQRDTDGWGIAGAITPSSSSSSNFGGELIEIRDDVALIGDTGADILDNSEGAAYLFRRVGGGDWMEEVMLIASDGEEFDNFGNDGALTERFVLIGAYGAGENAFTGAVYAYDLTRIVVAEPEVPMTEASSLSVHPNPTSALATISLGLPTAQIVRVAVYDVLGREVAMLHDGSLGAGEHNFRHDTSALPSGLYLVRVTGGGHRATRKLVVTRGL